MSNNYAFIMAGGVGSRFWPMSTPEKPKQFLDVLGLGKTLLQMTFDRLKAIAPANQIFILTNEAYADLVCQQLPEIQRSQVLTEPQRKNTAPCIAYAAAKIQAMNPQAQMVVCPADHLILKEELFVHNIQNALKQAESGRIVTLGIKPTRPDTGYGYIEFESDPQKEILPVKQFREKPDLETAKGFVESGNFYWNSGIFIWSSKTVLDALNSFQPELYRIFTEHCEKYNTAEEQAMINQCFEQCEDISIDYAVMEHAKNVDVVLANFEWSDLGTWGSLYDHLSLDENGNSVIGDGVHLFHSNGCQINVPNGKTVLIDGLSDYIVVESNNTLMVLKKSNEQELKKYLQTLNK